MSPKTHKPTTTRVPQTQSPWTEVYRTNPVHREGNYDNQAPEHDDSQSPTWLALSAMYDPSERE